MEDYMLNISPIDGRYQKLTAEVRQYFSEYHLIKNRVVVEIEWLKRLICLKELGIKANKEEIAIFDKIKKEFNIKRSKKSKRNRRSYKA